MNELENAISKAKTVCTEHPLAAVGTAFGVGLALSGATMSEKISAYLKENEGVIKDYVSNWLKDTLSIQRT